MTTSSRIALVTGGGRGLGRVMALALLQAGHDVIVASTDVDALAETLAAAAAMPGRAKAIAVDLAVAGEAERLADEALATFGRIDILLNNAGISVSAVSTDHLVNPYRFWRSDRAVIERFFAINAVAPMVLATRLAPAMIERGWGRIVANTTSLDTMLRFSLYGGSKAALEAETAVMANDLAGTGVTSNVLVPGGGTGTRMTDKSGIPREQLFPDTIMAAPAVFLASDASNDFSGRRILANRWKPGLPEREAAELASDPIAWTGYGSLGVQPAMARK
ncbi:SDR family NAD(P)-dependent oxidoreductase [Noviherbaspirillum sedimenti]|nr:SDR family oxidoreductase [Noviherbaspirillum sedimenti]